MKLKLSCRWHQTANIILLGMAWVFQQTTANAEVLQGALSIVGRQPSIIGPAPAIYGQVGDRTDLSQQYTVVLCVDDSTQACVTTNSVTLTANCTASGTLGSGSNGTTTCGLASPANHFYWTIPASVGSVNLHDGNDHTVYGWARAKSTSDILIDFMGGGGSGTGNAPFHIRYDVATGNLFPQYTAPTTAPTALDPNKIAVWADTSQTFSVGSAGATVCAGGSTGSGSTAIKDDGIVGYFIQQHSIPCANVFEVTLGALSDNISQATFNSTFGTLMDAMSASIQWYAVGWERPNVVQLTRGTGPNCEPVGGSPKDCASFVGYMTMYSNMSPHGTMPAYTDCFGKSYGVGKSIDNPWFNTGNGTPFTTNSVRPTWLLPGAICTGGCSNSSTNTNKTWAENFNAGKLVIDAAIAGRNSNPTGVSNVSYSSPGTHAETEWSPSSNGTVLNPKVTSTLLGTYAAPTSVDVTSGTCSANCIFYDNDSQSFKFTNISFAPGAGFFTMSGSVGGGIVTGGSGQTAAIAALVAQSTTAGGVNGNPAVLASGTNVEPCEYVTGKQISPDLFMSLISKGWEYGPAAWMAQLDWTAINIIGDPFAKGFPTPANPPVGITFKGVRFGGKVTVH